MPWACLARPSTRGYAARCSPPFPARRPTCETCRTAAPSRHAAATPSRPASPRCRHCARPSRGAARVAFASRTGGAIPRHGRHRGRRAMLLYTIRRIAYAIPIALAVSVICFLLVHIAPGDPINAIVPPDAPKTVVDQVRKDYGLDRPLPVQFGYWL